MKKVFPVDIGIIFICFLLILSCTPTGQKSAEQNSAEAKSTAEETETIKIGLIGPFSGAFRETGLSFHAGIKFAVKEQNAKGGLLGKKIEIIRADSKFKPDVASKKALQLILEDKVHFIVSGGGSHEALALNRVATQHRTILIHNNQSADSLQGMDFSRYAFRVFANNYAMTSAMAQFMATKPYRKYYIVCPDYDYGHELSNEFKKQIEQYIPDAQIVGEDYHTLKIRNFRPYIDKIKATKADVIFSGSFNADLYYLIRQARKHGLVPPFPITTVYTLPRTYVRKEDAPGIFSVVGYTMLVDTPENKAMVAKYDKQHKYSSSNEKWVDPPRGGIIVGWQMVFAAVEKAGSLDPEKIIETFEGFRYKSPVGWWHMRKCDHQVILPMFGMSAQAEPNPNYPSTIYGPDIVKIPAENTAIPATSDYNPRCP